MEIVKSERKVKTCRAVSLSVTRRFKLSIDGDEWIKTEKPFCSHGWAVNLTNGCFYQSLNIDELENKLVIPLIDGEPQCEEAGEECRFDELKRGDLFTQDGRAFFLSDNNDAIDLEDGENMREGFPSDSKSIRFPDATLCLDGKVGE